MAHPPSLAESFSRDFSFILPHWQVDSKQISGTFFALWLDILPFISHQLEYEYNGKIILYIRVPVCSNVCRCNGRIFDRNHEADIDITNHSDEVYRLYARKSGSYFVSKVTHFGMDALRKAYLKPLLDPGELVMTIPDKPNSRNQKYIAANKT